MKKILILFTMVLFMFPITARADEITESATPLSSVESSETASPSVSPSPSPSQESTQEPDEEESISVSLAIDDKNIYAGMDKAYQDGYTPTVSNGTATIVLPLLASGEIQDNSIMVTPGLGDTSSSPFVYKNYQKTVELSENAINNGNTTVSSYLVRFDLALSSDRINGVYPVTIDVQATDTEGNTISQSFTCYVTITDGEDPDAETETEEETPVSQPKIIVSSYSVNPSPVTAGEGLTVTVTLKNTSDTQSVQNMMVTVSCDSTNFVLQNDSSTIYIGKLKKGKTTDIEITYDTDLETPAQRYNITLAMEYDNSEAATLSSSGTVSVEVTQALRVEMEAPSIESEVNAGDTMPLSFQVMNLGRSAVYNVRIELSAPGLIPSGTAFIGNMEAGTSSTADMSVFIGTKDMSEGYEDEDKYGYTSGTITLIYEDAAGQEYTQETEFSTTINEPVITVSTNDEPEEEQEKAGQWWISLIIGGVVIVGLVTLLVYRKKRKV